MDPQQNAGIGDFGVGGYYPIHAFTVVSVYEAGFDVGDTAPVVLSDGLLFDPRTTMLPAKTPAYCFMNPVCYGSPVCF